MRANLRVWACALAALCVFSANAVAANAYPDKPVRLIVGFPPGGAADILARIAAQHLTDLLGEQVVVDNRGGAGGLIATELAAKAEPDGYTLLFTSIPFDINPHLYRKVTYDPIRDFSPAALFVTVPLLLAVNPAMPVKSVQELIDYAKARPGQVNYASAGSGSSSHLAMELFKTMAHVNLNHIPYKGTGPLITDLISGRVSVTIASAVPLIPQVKAGKLRGLATTGAKRAAALPDLPTIGETVPGYEVINWFGILAPAGTPHDVIRRINQAIDKTLARQDVRTLLVSRGADPAGGTPQAFARMIKADFVKWGKVVKASGAHVD